MQRICVFCGSSLGMRKSYAEAARELGELLAKRGIGLVYGGANAGLMGVVADAALAAGGEVIGVIPKSMMLREIDHPGLTKLHIVGSMHERKAMMADLADGFIAMPGGFGTFEEFCEILTWAQLGLHKKPCGLLNVDGYYEHLLTLFDHAAAEGLLRPAYREMVLSDADSTRLLERMSKYRAPQGSKWIKKDET